MRLFISFSAAMVLLFAAMAGALALNPTVISTGTVTASGAGMAHVRIFAGSATITGKGRLRVSVTAQVTITAGSAGATAQVANKKTGKTGWVIYKKFNGTATITGQDVHAYMHGKAISLSATGDGRAHFVGTGTYSIQTEGKAAETGKWATKPATTTKPAAGAESFERSIRRVYGVYEFKNGKDDTEGDADLS